MKAVDGAGEAAGAAAILGFTTRISCDIHNVGWRDHSVLDYFVTSIVTSSCTDAALTRCSVVTRLELVSVSVSVRVIQRSSVRHKTASVAVASRVTSTTCGIRACVRWNHCSCTNTSSMIRMSSKRQAAPVVRLRTVHVKEAIPLLALVLRDFFQQTRHLLGLLTTDQRSRAQSLLSPGRDLSHRARLGTPPHPCSTHFTRSRCVTRITRCTRPCCTRRASRIRSWINY